MSVILAIHEHAVPAMLFAAWLVVVGYVASIVRGAR